jgi:hypothetical protein
MITFAGLSAFLFCIILLLVLYQYKCCCFKRFSKKPKQAVHKKKNELNHITLSDSNWNIQTNPSFQSIPNFRNSCVLDLNNEEEGKSSNKNRFYTGDALNEEIRENQEVNRDVCKLINCD